jgi:hypothetical protein
VNRKATRRQVEAAVRPMLTKDEELRRSGPAWAVEHRGKAPLLFRARDLHEVVLTDQRFILLSRPQRRRPLGVKNLVLAKRYSTFSLERARRLRPMLQLRVRTSAERVLVLEFRPRDRKIARDLLAAMGPPRRGRRRPVPATPAPATPEPATPEPVRLEPPEPEPVRLEPREPEPVRFEPPPEPLRFEPPEPEDAGASTEKLSRKERRRARKEAKRADGGEEESRTGGDRRQAWEGPPGGFERRKGADRRSDWDDAKPSRKERRQARKERKERDRAAGDIDITEQLRQ